ncbi:MAG: VWA domain-containing protein [Proteobacteria bacterium]|nr:VWA domain-containing protein [Pseudomonadota bacterium]
MNTHSFEHELKQLAAPPPDPAARERARRAALEEFQRRPGTVHQLHSPRRWRPLGPWSSGLAAASIAAVGVAVYWLLPPEERVLAIGEPATNPSVPTYTELKREEPEPPQSSTARAERSAITTAPPPPKMELPAVETPPPVMDIMIPQEALPASAISNATDRPRPAVAPAPPPPPLQASTRALEEVQVTGSRRVSREFDSPMAVTTIIADTLESENRDKFQHFDVNPVKRAAEEPVSTFSADVDTASYSYVRRQLDDGVLPPADAVRVEEMVNYFDYAWPAPASRSAPFQPTITVSDSPWGTGKKLVHIGIRGFDLPAARRPDVNLVLLLDVSGSMNSPDKLPLAQRSMALLLDSLKPTDTVAIVVYAGAAGQVLAPTPVREKQAILDALGSLRPGGSTAGAAGIQLAYELAGRSFRKDGVNRILLATDGDFNVGITDREALKSLVERERDKGVFLSVLGFGQGNYRDEMAQTLAQNGNGVAAYIDTLNEARKVLVEQASAALFTIAKDVKLQVEFNPATVAEYRLVGYESRGLNREDFNNDQVDAGDIGAGHVVTAIYEITPAGSSAQLIDERRYATGTDAPPRGRVAPGEYGYLRIRYKLPDSTRSRLIESPIRTRASVPAALRQDVQFSTAVAGFAQLLRGGRYTGGLSFEDVLREAQASRGEDPYGYRAEFVQLVRRAMQARGIQ